MENRFLIQLIELVDSYNQEGIRKIDFEIRLAEKNGYTLSSRESKYLVELLRSKIDKS